MKKNNKIATLSYLAYGDKEWGRGSDEGEPGRKRILCKSVPEALHWLSGGHDLAGLERLVYSWAAGGAREAFCFQDQRLRRNGGWFEDIDIKLEDFTEDSAWDAEIENSSEEYAQDILSYLGIGPGIRG